jgi:hypothetical protein
MPREAATHWQVANVVLVEVKLKLAFEGQVMEPLGRSERAIDEGLGDAMIANEVEPDILKDVRKLGREASLRARFASPQRSKIEDCNLLSRAGPNRR